MAGMFLFYVIQKKTFLKTCIFFQIFYHTEFQDIIFSETKITDTLHVCTTAMLVLLVIEN